MIIIKYHQSDEAAITIKNRLQEMTLAFQEEKMEQKKVLELADGTKTFTGIEAITQYLDDLERELPAWYACSFEPK